MSIFIHSFLQQHGYHIYIYISLSATGLPYSKVSHCTPCPALYSFLWQRAHFMKQKHICKPFTQTGVNDPEWYGSCRVGCVGHRVGVVCVCLWRGYPTGFFTSTLMAVSGALFDRVERAETMRDGVGINQNHPFVNLRGIGTHCSILTQVIRWNLHQGKALHESKRVHIWMYPARSTGQHWLSWTGCIEVHNAGIGLIYASTSLLRTSSKTKGVKLRHRTQRDVSSSSSFFFFFFFLGGGGVFSFLFTFTFPLTLHLVSPEVCDFWGSGSKCKRSLLMHTPVQTLEVSRFLF